MSNLTQSHKILFINTLAFTICFACWTLNGVLVTFLIEKGIYNWSVIEAGWLMGIPILSGAIARLPIGILTDKYGGKKVFTWLLFSCSIPLFLIPLANSFWGFAILSLLFGLVGASFAVGIGFTSVWYPKEWQGRALGIFGMGNAGAAITTFLAPSLLNHFSIDDPQNGWKLLPILYGFALVIIGILLTSITLLILFIAYKKLLARLGKGTPKQEDYCVLYGLEETPSKNEVSFYFTSNSEHSIELSLLTNDFNFPGK